MAAFYYNRSSKENIHSQWLRYLQHQEYIKDISGIISENKTELQNTIKDASKQQIDVFKSICGNLDDGFSILSAHLEDIHCDLMNIGSQISELASMIDWKLSMLIEGQKLTNRFLKSIEQLLRIPDSQKQRLYHIEQGLKYFKNALLEGIQSNFYNDAFQNLLLAKDIEKNDFITLNIIGQIYLYSQKHMNFAKAEEYFLMSAREASAEYNFGGTTVSNNMTPAGYQSSKNFDPFLYAATEALLYAGRACYLQEKFKSAQKCAGHAYSSLPDFLQAGFEYAKYSAAILDDNEAVRVLWKVIKEDRFFSISVTLDKDLNSRPPVLKLLNTFYENAKSDALYKYNLCKDSMRDDSIVLHILQKIKKLIKHDSFLSYMSAIDILDDIHTITYFEYSIPDGTSEFILSKEEIISKSLIEIIQHENNSLDNLESLKSELRKEFILSRSQYGLGLGSSLGFIIGFFRGCSLSPISMDWSTWLTTILVFAILFSIGGAYIGSAKQITVRDKIF